ncbi:hypothetical protein HKD37_19G054490 [Glycine soja]
MKSPTTVVSQDQTCTHEICLSPNTPGSFPVEADAISMESGSEDDRMNTTTLITAEDSSFEHWSNDVNPVTVNEVVAIDNATNMSIHSAQLNSVEADAGTSASTAVPEFRQGYSVTSPVCDESTALESPETTLPYMQPSDSNWWPLPQVSSFSTRSLMVLLLAFIDNLCVVGQSSKLWSTSCCFVSMATNLKAIVAIFCFLENNSGSTVMPLDDIFCHSSEDHCYIHEAEVILEAPNDLNSSFVSPVILQPFTSVLMNENTAHVPDSITIPGFMNSDYFQAHSVTSEMAIIENMNEEAFRDPHQ